MAFDGQAFVADLQAELEASGRGLDRATWVEKVARGTATKEELVGWARAPRHELAPRPVPASREEGVAGSGASGG